MATYDPRRQTAMVLGEVVAAQMSTLQAYHGPRVLSVVLSVCLLFFGGRTIGAQASGLRALVGSVFSATVTTIVDGDTVHVVDARGREIVVRLEGIDTPERGEPYSTQARNATRVLLFSKIAELRATDVDRYGRLVARAFVDRADISLALVRMGLACHFTRYSADRRLAEAQEEAQRTGTVVSVKWWKSVQRVIVRPVDYAARFTASMS